MTTIMRVENMDFALLIMMLVPNMTSGKIAFTSSKLAKRMLQRNFLAVIINF